MIQAIIKYQFMQNALLASILASVVAGIIGVIIVEKRLVMMSGGIAHTTYGGVGLGYLLGIEPIIGGFVFAIGAGLGIGALKRKGGVGKTDTLIAMFWSLGMALGIAFIGLVPGYPPDLSTYLFGNILSVTHTDMVMMTVLTMGVVLAIFVFYNDWKTYLFDEEFATIRGLNTTFMEYSLLVIIAMSIVVLIRVAGIMLVISMLTAPAVTAKCFTKSFGKNIFLAIGFGAIYCIIGLTLSYYFNIASGATIIIVSILGFVIAKLIEYFSLHKKRN